MYVVCKAVINCSSGDRIMIEGKGGAPLVSVIIPAYNAADSIGQAIMSVLDTARCNEIEILVVDDCSTDSTADEVLGIRNAHPNVFLFNMPENSGGPSAPRNLGIGKARGEYVTFLDDDDWINADNMLSMTDYALAHQMDFLKGYLYVIHNGKQTPQNRLPYVPKDSADALKCMVSLQSTTQDFLVRRKVLMDNNLRYDRDLKIGEDTVFVLSILTRCQEIGYIDKFFLFYNKTPVDLFDPSSTQRCGDREVNDQITAWERSEKILSSEQRQIHFKILLIRLMPAPTTSD